MQIGVFDEDAFAYNNHGYPYGNNPCLVNQQCPSYDPNGFCRSHCTSYSSYMLNQYGVPFNNGYKGIAWSHGRNWDNAAKAVSIPFDKHPLPGDIAQWNNLGGWGHVAWVEKVYFDSNGNATDIDITEYNYNSCTFSSRTISASNPDNFIHILAYNEGVTGLFYIDCYEQSSLCNFQTPQEWGWIIQRVSNYRCSSCGGQYQSFANGFFNGLGMGGGSNSALPDFIVNSIWLEDSSGNDKTLFVPGEQIKMKAQFKNKGSNSPSSIQVKFYLSNGKKVDGNKQHVGTDTIQASNMESGETHTETESIYAPTTPGTYNITSCADTQKVVAEEHESNNCSEEAVFSVVNISAVMNIIANYLNW